jgi:exonuclease III
MRLFSWNVNNRVRCVSEQVAAVMRLAPDVVALQEVNKNACAAYAQAFTDAGLPYVCDSFSSAADACLLTGRRTRGVLLASRWPFDVLPPTSFDIPWTERVLSALVDSPHGQVEIHAAYIPTSGVADTEERWIKIYTHEGMVQRLACPCSTHRILCGDFNAPQAETVSGEVITFGQKIRANGVATCIGGWGERWDAGERGLMCGLGDYGLHDVFRTVNGWEAQAFSWYARGRFGFRLDHIFASPSLNPISCDYEQAFRTDGLSDHAAMIAVFAP